MDSNNNKKTTTSNSFRTKITYQNIPTYSPTTNYKALLARFHYHSSLSYILLNLYLTHNESRYRPMGKKERKRKSDQRSMQQKDQNGVFCDHRRCERLRLITSVMAPQINSALLQITQNKGNCCQFGQRSKTVKFILILPDMVISHTLLHSHTG